jgi:hypothetical protein
VESAGKLLAAGIAVLYATGFLVASAFLERFGIGETGAEFLKIKYLQIGLLFMLFPCLVVAPIYAFLYLRRAPGVRLRPTTAGIINIASLLVVCYLLATYSSLGHFHEKRWWIAILFSWTMLGVAFAGRLTLQRHPQNYVVEAVGQRFDRWCVSHPSLGPYRKEIVRGLFCIGSLTLNCMILGRFAGAAWACIVIAWLTRVAWRHYSRKALFVNVMIGLGAVAVAVFVISLFRPDLELLSRVWFYYVYCIFAGYLVWQQWMKIPKRHGKKTRPLAWVWVTCVAAGLYYMAIHAFAYGVYPQIPSAKGGGNFCDAPNVQIVWKRSEGVGTPLSFLSEPDAGPSGVQVSIPLKVIHETPELLFAADPRGGAADRWREWEIPNILVLRTDSVAERILLPSSDAQ